MSIRPQFPGNDPYSGNDYSNMPQYPRMSQQSQSVGLNGKFVDNYDIVKVTEVPMGGYGIFPKADLSEI